jgi:Zn-dependent oligopeptidase
VSRQQSESAAVGALCCAHSTTAQVGSVRVCFVFHEFGHASQDMLTTSKLGLAAGIR